MVHGAVRPAEGRSSRPPKGKPVTQPDVNTLPLSEVDPEIAAVLTRMRADDAALLVNQ